MQSRRAEGEAGWMASGSVRMAGAARASKVCDRCAVVRRECVAKGLGVCASVGNKVWKVALESTVGCGSKCDVRPLSRPTAGGGRRAGEMRACGLVDFRWSAIARRVGGDGWTPETPPDRDRDDLLVERGIGEAMRGMRGDEGRENRFTGRMKAQPVPENLFLVACVRVPVCPS